RVTFKAERITVRDAFAKVLAGTNLSVVDAGNGQYAIATAAASQLQGTIVGKVIHAKTKQPIVGATVTLGAGTTVATTDENGSFQIASPGGTQTVHIRALGYVRKSQQVTVVEGEA